MDFPNPCVLTSFLREYLFYRKINTWNRPTNIVSSFFSDGEAEKTGECVKINRSFYVEEKLNHLEGWIDLIYSLGEKGRVRYMFAETLQAIRSYIVHFLLSSDQQELFLEKRKKLREEVDKLNEQIFVEMRAKVSSKDVGHLEKKYRTKLMKLADLGEQDACFQAQRYHLFDALKYPDLSDPNLPFAKEINDNIPLCYQSNFHEIFYVSYLQPMKKWRIGFVDFVKESEKLPRDIKEDQLITEPQDPEKPNLFFRAKNKVVGIFSHKAKSSEEKAENLEWPSLDK